MGTPYVLVMLFLLVSVNAYALNPLETENKRERVSSEFLLEACTVVGETSHGMIPFFDCESYIYGVLDTLHSEASNDCIPQDIAPWEVYAELVNAPRSQFKQSAVQFIIATLKRKYPCR